MKQPPDKIYLQWHGDGEPDDVGDVYEGEVTWSNDKIFEHDIEYVQASRIAALEYAINTARIGIEIGSYSIALDTLRTALNTEGKA